MPWYFYRPGFLRRQRVAVIDVTARQVHASTETRYYFLPESFDTGRLVAIREPHASAQRVEWSIPPDLARFQPLRVTWAAGARLPAARP